MKTDRVAIDGHEYFLAQGEDVDRVKADVVEAVRDGGSMVDFSAVGGRAVSVLVTPGVPVLFEVVERDHEDDAVDDQPITFDIADYPL